MRNRIVALPNEPEKTVAGLTSGSRHSAARHATLPSSMELVIHSQMEPTKMLPFLRGAWKRLFSFAKGEGEVEF